jgi:hypothetical protein
MPTSILFTRRARQSAAASLLALCAAVALPAHAQSSTVGLRSYIDSLGASYPAQSAANAWTFRDAGASGPLFGNGGTFYSGFGLYQQVGLKVDTGTLGCTAGFCNVPFADTLATFNGVFVHPGASNATAIVYRFDSAVVLENLRLLTESVQNGAVGNGITVGVDLIRGGVGTPLTSFLVTHAVTVSTALVTELQPGLALQPGDALQILIGGNGNYLYDHYNMDVQITTAPVPEPGTAALWAAGLGVLGLLARRRRADRAA